MQRPAKCWVCGEKMYYSEDKRYEPEMRISLSSGLYSYIHTKCWQKVEEFVKGCKKCKNK